MLKKLFNRKNDVPVSLIGQQAELFHDATVFQYGTIFLNNKRYSVRTEDGSELCKGTTVEVVAENSSHLVVKKV